MALASLNVPQKVDTPLRLSLSVSLAGAARPGASRLFLLCVGIAMSSSALVCASPPSSGSGASKSVAPWPGRRTLWSSFRRRQRRTTPPLVQSNCTPRQRVRRQERSSGQFTGFGVLTDQSGSRYHEFLVITPAEALRVRLVRQVALCSGSHRLFYAEPVTQGGWKARQMTDADIQLPG